MIYVHENGYWILSPFTVHIKPCILWISNVIAQAHIPCQQKIYH